MVSLRVLSLSTMTVFYYCFTFFPCFVLTSFRPWFHRVQQKKRVNGIRKSDESHDHKERQSCTLQKRLPVPLEIVFNSDSELVFSLRSKRRFRKAHLEAARWVMRTSFETQSVLHQFPVNRHSCSTVNSCKRVPLARIPTT